MLRTCIALATLTSVASAQVDISVSQIGGTYDYYGMSNGIRAYAIGTTACNVGSVWALWRDSTEEAPIIGTNMFRLKSDGGFEQLGYSYVKYSFCAADAGGAGCPNSCQSAGTCDWLGLGCADTYWAGLNDGINGGAKYNVDPVTGIWPANQGGPTSGNSTIRGRIQVQNTELQDAGALYFSEGQYISQDDHADGNARNNYAWRRMNLSSPTNPGNLANTVMGDPAIYAWQAHANGVLIEDLIVENEGGPDLDGHVFVGSMVDDLGGGLYRYFYSVQNGNSGRAISSLSVPAGGSITDVYYHDVTYHSGSPYSNTPWSSTVNGGSVTWESTQTHAQNQNANVIRWGTMFSFAFTSTSAPSNGLATLDIFAPGAGGDTLSANVIVPTGGCGGVFTDYCSANVNSSGFPAHIFAGGTADIGNNDLVMSVNLLPQNQFGYFLMSENQAFIPNFAGSNGNLCVGSPQKRFSQNVLHSGLNGEVTMQIDNQNLPQNSTFDPGDTWNFQYWYRDVGSSSNTSAGIQVDFCN